MVIMRFILLALVLMLLPLKANAVVLSADAVPNAQNVPFTQMTTITISWRVEVLPQNPSYTLSSAVGEFRIAGNTVATTRSLSRSFRSQSGVNAFQTITETVVVPLKVILQAQQQNAVLSYSRDFSDDNVLFQQGEQTLNITGGASGSAAVSDQDLVFENGSSYASVAVGEKLRAVANIFMNGTGVVRGVWEVSADNGIGQSDMWRPIRNVTQQAMANSNIRLISPNLPTDVQGRMRVRFRITEPHVDASVAIPFIDYFINGNESGEAEKAFIPKIPAKDGGGLKQ